MVGACSSSVSRSTPPRTGQERSRRRTAGQILRPLIFACGVGKESEALLQIVFVVVEEHVQTQKSARGRKIVFVESEELALA
jgi:hypothetical protein